MCAGDYKNPSNQSVYQDKQVVEKSSNGYTVRRLTPTECERLMGFPDGWTKYGQDNRQISDSKRYAMLGNSDAVPCVAYIMQGIVNQIEQEEYNGSQN